MKMVIATLFALSALGLAIAALIYVTKPPAPPADRFEIVATRIGFSEFYAIFRIDRATGKGSSAIDLATGKTHWGEAGFKWLPMEEGK